MNRTGPEVHACVSSVTIAGSAAQSAGAGVSVELAERRAEQLPFPEASFDCVTSTLMLHHLAPEPKRAAIREAARVLRPGGRLVIADWGRPRDPLTGLAFLAVRLLDGFAPTSDHAAGRLPELLTGAGLAAVRTEQRWPTVWGQLELFTAQRDPSAQTSVRDADGCS